MMVPAGTAICTGTSKATPILSDRSPPSRWHASPCTPPSPPPGSLMIPARLTEHHKEKDMNIAKLIKDLSKSGAPVTVNIYVGDHYHCEPGGYIAVRGGTIHG